MTSLSPLASVWPKGCVSLNWLETFLTSEFTLVDAS
jgi:hypothetical protein